MRAKIDKKLSGAISGAIARKTATGATAAFVIGQHAPKQFPALFELSKADKKLSCALTVASKYHEKILSI